MEGFSANPCAVNWEWHNGFYPVLSMPVTLRDANGGPLIQSVWQLQLIGWLMGQEREDGDHKKCPRLSGNDVTVGTTKWPLKRNLMAARERASTQSSSGLSHQKASFTPFRSRWCRNKPLIVTTQKRDCDGGQGLSAFLKTSRKFVSDRRFHNTPRIELFSESRMM